MKLFMIALAMIGYLGTCQGIEGEAFNITLAMFSGVPDPQWLITPKTLNYEKIKKLFTAAKDVRANYLPEQIPPQLGFKGFLVHEDGQADPCLIVGPKTKELQEMLLDSCPTKHLKKIKNKLVKSIKKALATIIKVGKVLPVPLEKVKKSAEKRCPPVYKDAPLIWNNRCVQPYNNCYNYGNNLVTNTFAQPGRGSGQKFRELTNEKVKEAAIRDGLVYLEPGPGDSIPSNVSGNWHLVALVVDPGVDYHWYRLDSNGRWSHKPGQTPATNKDGNGARITDPRQAANVPGSGLNYRFVCFMKTKKNRVNIR